MEAPPTTADALQAIAKQVGLDAQHVKDLQAAHDLSRSCRAAIEHLMRTNPRGPMAGKLDLAADGLVGWLAARRKYAHLDDYNGDVMALRDLLRELDASPVVDVADLIEAVPLRDVGPNLRSADHWTEVLGGAGIVDASVAFLTRRPRKQLEWLDAKLLMLQLRLEERLKEAERCRRGWQDRYDEAKSTA